MRGILSSNSDGADGLPNGKKSKKIGFKIYQNVCEHELHGLNECWGIALRQEPTTKREKILNKSLIICDY